jgi:transcriptional regulator with XRE-family HTH domain
MVTGLRESRAIAANLGRDTRTTRRRRRLTQAELGGLVDLGQSEISYLERGFGGRTSIETWVAIGIALDRPIAMGFSRDVVDPLQDAGHLAAQELVIRLSTTGGWRATFEAASNPADLRHVTDVLLTNTTRTTVLVKIWNRVDDLGAAVRSSDRKLAEVSDRVRGPVLTCWVLVDTAANRAIVRRYPAVLRSRFRGSSAAWVRALMVAGGPVPSQAGIAWADVKSERLRPLRLAL